MLLIRDPGPATSIQDLGRPAARRWGVPVSGALCADWLRLANALVGNPPDAAGLEIRIAGPRLEAGADGLRIVAGGPVEMRVEGGETPRVVPPWTVVALEPGEVLRVGRVQTGTAAVLAVAGGIDTPLMLGSRATYARAGLGGLDGRALQPGDALPVGPFDAGAPPLALPSAPPDRAGPIRVILGPQDDHFTPEAVEAFLSTNWTVTDKTDRMGMRLDGPPLAHRSEAHAGIASDGIAPGAIQVPGAGAPIVLLADAQTVGGYPKIAGVISADLPRLARLAPGATLRFAAVETAEAEAALRARIAELDRLAAAARPAGPAGGLDLRALYAASLVGGVVDVTRPDHFPGHLEETA